MLLTGFAPIWVLTAVGYLVARSGVLGMHAEDVLGRFVFHVAMPAALFTLISRTPLDRFANASMLAFGTGTALAIGVGVVLAGTLFGRGTAERAVFGMAAGYVNSANLGIPVATQVLGDASFVAPVVLFQLLLVVPVMLTTLDIGTSRRRRTPRSLLALPLRNPILLAAALGALVSATGLDLPTELTRPCELLGGAGVPTALVALGMSLHRRTPRTGTAAAVREHGPAAGTGAAAGVGPATGTGAGASVAPGAGPGAPVAPPGAAARGGLGKAGGLGEVGAAVAVKTLLQPLAAWAVGAYALHLPPEQLRTVVLFSALPTAQNAFVYAREYRAGTLFARNAILCSTLVSMATLSVVAWALHPA